MTQDGMPTNAAQIRKINIINDCLTLTSEWDWHSRYFKLLLKSIFCSEFYGRYFHHQLASLGRWPMRHWLKTVWQQLLGPTSSDGALGGPQNGSKVSISPHEGGKEGAEWKYMNTGTTLIPAWFPYYRILLFFIVLLVNVTFLSFLVGFFKPRLSLDQFPCKLGRFWQFLDLWRAKYIAKAIKDCKAGKHIKGSLNPALLSKEYLYHVYYNKVITKETQPHCRQALLRKNSFLCGLLRHVNSTSWHISRAASADCDYTCICFLHFTSL